MNVDVLMTTVPLDIHAGAVSVALDRLGCSALRWYPSAYPLADGINFAHGVAADPKLSLVSLAGPQLTFPDDSIGSFWFRRQGSPTLPASLHEADRAFSLRSCERVLESAIAIVSQNAALPVNDYHSAVRAEKSKILQLQTAQQLGLRCPETLISNNPQDIAAFIRASEDDTIFKSLMFVVWESDAGQATNFTSSVRIEDLPSEAILRSCPGIFQRKLAKQYEIRVTIMGDWAMAFRLDSQSLDDSRVDWRVSGANVPLQQVSLPRAVLDKCLALMRQLHLSFGCIDLIVTPDEEYVFLEVNQQGQFLWLEERNEDAPLLDAFAQFLQSKDALFKGPKRSPRSSFNAIRDEAWALMQDDLRRYPIALPIQDNTIREGVTTP